jgi:hypothetical protein
MKHFLILIALFVILKFMGRSYFQDHLQESHRHQKSQETQESTQESTVDSDETLKLSQN